MEENPSEVENQASNDHKYKIKTPKLDEIADRASKLDQAKNLHNKMIIIQVLNYQKQGYTNIKVNHANVLKSQPDQINGYTPDLSADLNGKTTICEVETSDSINDTSAVEKWKAFDNSGHLFHLIVPHNAFHDAKEIARSNRISIDKYWSINDY